MIQIFLFQLPNIYIYINRRNSEKVQLKFETKIQVCAMCLNLCGDQIILFS